MGRRPWRRAAAWLAALLLAAAGTVSASAAGRATVYNDMRLHAAVEVRRGAGQVLTVDDGEELVLEDAAVGERLSFSAVIDIEYWDERSGAYVPGKSRVRASVGLGREALEAAMVTVGFDHDAMQMTVDVEDIARRCAVEAGFEKAAVAFLRGAAGPEALVEHSRAGSADALALLVVAAFAGWPVPREAGAPAGQAWPWQPLPADAEALHGQLEDAASGGSLMGALALAYFYTEGFVVEDCGAATDWYSYVVEEARNRDDQAMVRQRTAYAAESPEDDAPLAVRDVGRGFGGEAQSLSQRWMMAQSAGGGAAGGGADLGDVEASALEFHRARAATSAGEGGPIDFTAGESALLLGETYLYGRSGVPGNATMALAYLKRASEAGLEVADELLGRLYLHGAPGVAPSPELARRHFEASATAPSLYSIGVLELEDAFETGISEEERTRKLNAAAELFRRSADMNYPDGALAYALHVMDYGLEEGEAAEKRPRRVKWAKEGLDELSEVERVLVERYLGVVVEQGEAWDAWDVISEAYYWLGNLALHDANVELLRAQEDLGLDEGDADDEAELSGFEDELLREAEEDWHGSCMAAVRHFQRAAELTLPLWRPFRHCRDPSTGAEVGTALSRELRVERVVEAYEAGDAGGAFRVAALLSWLGLADAQLNAGYILSQNFSMAPSAVGHAPAARGTCSSRGPADGSCAPGAAEQEWARASAVRLYEMAAEQDSAEAWRRLGDCAFEGWERDLALEDGVTCVHSLEESVSRWRKAAELGDIEGLRRSGLVSALGLPGIVPQNRTAASQMYATCSGAVYPLGVPCAVEAAVMSVLWAVEDALSFFSSFRLAELRIVHFFFDRAWLPI